jgi:hypothetical protein
MDPLRAQREIDADWIDSLTSFLSSDWVESAVVRDRRENPPQPGVVYVHTLDQSQLRGDAFTYCIGHMESGGRFVQDLMRSWQGSRSSTVNLASVVQEIVAIGRLYGGASFIGDQQAKDWVAQEFQRAGGGFTKSAKNTSDCYLESEPYFAQGKVDLLDDPQLIRELKLLERVARPGGKTTVQHPRNSHDDRAASLCRGIVNAAGASGSSLWAGGQRIAPAGW